MGPILLGLVFVTTTTTTTTTTTLSCEDRVEYQNLTIDSSVTISGDTSTGSSCLNERDANDFSVEINILTASNYTFSKFIIYFGRVAVTR